MTALVCRGASLADVLRVDAVSVRYPDGTAALADVSLRVGAGEIVAVVGPSGCGKSTLLRVVAGLLAPSEGTVRVERAGLGYVFQDATLLPWRTVRANVALLAELQGLDAAERRRRVDDALALVDLAGFEDAYPRQLSGGMRMRVSLARALTLSPSLFLLDEPFGALDELTRERLQDELLGLWSARRFAALLVTHSVHEAVFLSSRVLVMSPRPGAVVGEVEVPYPFPRHPELRYEAGLAERAGAVSELLRAGRAGPS